MVDIVRRLRKIRSRNSYGGFMRRKRDYWVGSGTGEGREERRVRRISRMGDRKVYKKLSKL